MPRKRPTTIAEYIEAAPPEGREHLRELHRILKDVAPEAEETIKWGMPFFVEPRFLFAFSAHKAHLGFNASNEALEPYRAKLRDFEITRMGIVKLPYSRPIPQDLIRKIARTRVKLVREREDRGFW